MPRETQLTQGNPAVLVRYTPSHARFAHSDGSFSTNPRASMTNPARGTRGMAVAPHSLAAQSALAILREGGNALEAMVAAAATIAVVYPHMNSIGGDAFWLIHVPGRSVRGID